MATWATSLPPSPSWRRRSNGASTPGWQKTIATLRRDGSPRISGTEADFVLGELWFGPTWGARKARDLQRDPRFALHTASADPPGWDGDAKLSWLGRGGHRPRPVRAYQAARAGGDDPAANEAPARFHLFGAELAEVVVIGLNEARERLVIEHWARGPRACARLERE